MSMGADLIRREVFIPKSVNWRMMMIVQHSRYQKKLSVMMLFAAFVLRSHSGFAMIIIYGMRSYLKAEKDYTKADYLLAGNYMGSLLSG